MRFSETDLQKMLGKKRADEIIGDDRRRYFTRKNKFSAQRTKAADGTAFDSKREARNHRDLEIRQRLGEISHLRRQVRFPLRVNGRLVCRYIADHAYVEDGRYVVADSKGFKTPEYKLKKKLMEAIYGITILEL